MGKSVNDAYTTQKCLSTYLSAFKLSSVQRFTNWWVQQNSQCTHLSLIIYLPYSWLDHWCPAYSMQYRSRTTRTSKFLLAQALLQIQRRPNFNHIREPCHSAFGPLDMTEKYEEMWGLQSGERTWLVDEHHCLTVLRSFHAFTDPSFIWVSKQLQIICISRHDEDCLWPCRIIVQSWPGTLPQSSSGTTPGSSIKSSLYSNIWGWLTSSTVFPSLPLARLTSCRTLTPLPWFWFRMQGCSLPVIISELQSFSWRITTISSLTSSKAQERSIKMTSTTSFSSISTIEHFLLDPEKTQCLDPKFLDMATDKQQKCTLYTFPHPFMHSPATTAGNRCCLCSETYIAICIF